MPVRFHASTLLLALCFLLVFASDYSVSSRRINPIFLGAPTPPPPSCHNANATAATASSLSSSKVTDAAMLLASSSNETVVSTPTPLSSRKVSAVLTPPQSTQNAIAASAQPSPRRNFMQHSHASRAKRIIMGGREDGGYVLKVFKKRASKVTEHTGKQ
ncbi:hypothetical protein CKAN_01622900 [Cinnamomum micranthum f. kanehirae]|uniref:Uncharacterized protein n=1 Tax=Cinnamomum micranthum f. kanehirae TaxID=337451 RepID=A0A3S3QNP6_9MAGN|nr:hypothetical protein CKAN_01622900 [Cinnamomum micranthum f. kanehirae]